MFSMLIKPNIEKFAKIKVVGVGGAGGNALNTMISSGNILGVDFLAINTDKQALNMNKADEILQIGQALTHGLGSGAMPEVGKKAAEESKEDIKKHLEGYDMIFITAGMGGGTGTGGAPIVASLAKEAGSLTVAVVTKPFNFEGATRKENAENGIRELKENVDALITIPNQKLLDLEQKSLPLKEAFALADSVLMQGVKGISDLIVHPGLINVDFADVKTIMYHAGSALMGIGEAEGEGRAEIAAEQAINSPLLDVSIGGATGILINIVGDGLTLAEVEVISQKISSAAGIDSNIIFGANPTDNNKGKISVTVIATGFDSSYDDYDDTYKVSKRADSKVSVSEDTKSSEIEKSKDDLDKDIEQIVDDNEEDPYKIPTFLRRG